MTLGLLYNLSFYLHPYIAYTISKRCNELCLSIGSLCPRCSQMRYICKYQNQASFDDVNSSEPSLFKRVYIRIPVHVVICPFVMPLVFYRHLWYYVKSLCFVLIIQQYKPACLGTYAWQCNYISIILPHFVLYIL